MIKILQKLAPIKIKSRENILGQQIGRKKNGYISWIDICRNVTTLLMISRHSNVCCVVVLLSVTENNNFWNQASRCGSRGGPGVRAPLDPRF